MIKLEVVGGRQTVAVFNAQVVAAPERVRRAVALWGDILLYTVKGMADGAPGPTRRTGHYVDSIRKEEAYSAGIYEVAVGTDEPYGYRLELGFYGTDSLGRQVSAPPYPHFGVAMNAIEGTFEAEVFRAVMEGW